MLTLRKAAKPYRVLLLYTSLRRDVASLFILDRLLTALGCDVVVAGPPNQDIFLALWRPHAVLHVTPSKVPRAMTLAPESRFFILNAEGAEGANRPVESALFRNPEFCRQVSRVYLWGAKPYELMLDSFRTPADRDVRRFLEEGDRIRVLGYFRADISRYIPRVVQRQPATLGFLSHFYLLNVIKRYSFITATFGIEESLLESEIQFKHYLLFNKAILALAKTTGHMISIRPHHMEHANGYYLPVNSLKGFRRGEFPASCLNGRVSLDYTPDYALWAIRQKAIVASDSSAFLDATILGVPYINIDQAAGNLDNIFARESLFGERALCAYRPASLEELLQCLEHPEQVRHDQERFVKLSKDYYTTENAGYILLNVAQDIVNVLDSNCHGLSPLRPKPFIQAKAAIDKFSLKLTAKLLGKGDYEHSQSMATDVYMRIADLMLQDAAAGAIPDLCRH